jgi:cation diffusion facilitator family transporter
MASTEPVILKELTAIDIRQTTDPVADNDPYQLSQYIKPASELSTIKNKELKSFYKRQNELIETFLTPAGAEAYSEETEQLPYKVAVYGSFAANVLLFVLQLLAALFSGSLALLATTADAFMDVASSTVLIVAGVIASKPNYIKYPTGKQKYKTAGIIVFSTLMATLSIQLFVESIKALTDGSHNLRVDYFTYGMLAIAFLLKFGLFLYCRLYTKYPAVKILAQDHLNDVVFNTTGVLFGILGALTPHWWLDPAGAIFIAVFIFKSWAVTAAEHIRLIVGVTAEPELISHLAYIAMTHDERIIQVDTVKAYHSGDLVFVEVDIMLDPSTPLDVSHDIGESLQEKIEQLTNVDRAFVHIDYETTHKPEHRKMKSASS